MRFCDIIVVIIVVVVVVVVVAVAVVRCGGVFPIYANLFHVDIFAFWLCTWFGGCVRCFCSICGVKLFCGGHMQIGIVENTYGSLRGSRFVFLHF